MSQAARHLVHTRSIQVEAYLRDDKLWDLVATVRDVKEKDVPLEGGVRRAGEAFHDMELTVTIDPRMEIVAARASTKAGPFMGDCDSFPEAYQQLVGLNLLQGFRAAVRERLGGNQGCTHITELAGVLPTAAIQAFSGEMTRPDRIDGSMPKHLDRCRALRLDGPVVARLYPRWAQNKQKGDAT
jgi:hypothetical protein